MSATALDDPLTVGIWGGTTTEERRRLRRDAHPAADDDVVRFDFTDADELLDVICEQ